MNNNKKETLKNSVMQEIKLVMKRCLREAEDKELSDMQFTRLVLAEVKDLDYTLRQTEMSIEGWLRWIKKRLKNQQKY